MGNKWYIGQLARIDIMADGVVDVFTLLGKSKDRNRGKKDDSLRASADDASYLEIDISVFSATA